MFISNFRLLVFIILAASSLGCSKSDSLLNNLQQQGSFSSVAVFNAIPKSNFVSIAINNANASYFTVTASDNLFFGNYLTYKNWFSGAVNMTVESNNSIGKESATKDFVFNSGTAYSLFLYKNERSIETLLSEDNVISPKEGKAKIRIANLCNNLANINLLDGNADYLLLKNIKYGSVSDYIEIDAKVAYNFLIETVDLEVELTSNTDVNIENKGVYTILVTGVFDKLENGVNISFTVIKQ